MNIFVDCFIQFYVNGVFLDSIFDKGEFTEKR